MFKRVVLLLGGVSILYLTGCTAIETASQHSSLQVNSVASNPLFLPPGSNPQKTLYIQVENTGNVAGDFTSVLLPALEAKGYHIVTDPAQAGQIVQVDLASLVRTVNEPAAADGSTIDDEAAAGATTGVLTGFATHFNGLATTAGAAAGAVGAAIVNGIVKDVSYALKADVVVQTQMADTFAVTQEQQIHWSSNKMTVTATADEVNLSLDKATPVLMSSLANSISSIF